MTIWAIADLHLSFGTPGKEMDIFGEGWVNHAARVKENWENLVKEDDLVLIPGDISWGLSLDDALPDLEWIDHLPGTKVLLKGNHDYWWKGFKKTSEAMPTSLHLIQNNSFDWKEITIGGSRMWDLKGLNFDPFIDEIDYPDVQPSTQQELNDEKNEKIFQRELVRLELSLKTLNPKAKTRIAMVHYPPVGPEMDSSSVSDILEKYHIDICVFGHIHSARKNSLPYGTKRGVRYVFVPCDYLNCSPAKIL